MERVLAVTFLEISMAFGPAAMADHDADPVDIIFDEIERILIEEYFRDDDGELRSDLPPGLAKREKLPPGLAKQLERNGHLPPGLEKHRLPDDLELALPPAKHGTERVIVGNDVILLDPITGAIFDIIRDVLAD
jgi:hypothetical protein